MDEKEIELEHAKELLRKHRYCGGILFVILVIMGASLNFIENWIGLVICIVGSILCVIFLTLLIPLIQFEKQIKKLQEELRTKENGTE